MTLTGKDRPGVTSAMFATLSAAGVEVVDIEQIVLRRRLVLGVLITAPRDWKKLRDAVEETASSLGMQVEVDRGVGDNREAGSGRSHVTVLGAPLRAAAMSAIAGRIADCGANIDRIERMARYPVTAIDLSISGVEPEVLRPLLATEAATQGIDIAVQPASLLRRGDAAHRDGRRLHPHPGRGHRDDRRARRSEAEVARRHRGGRCGASSTSRSPCASASRCWRACRSRPSPRSTTPSSWPPAPARWSGCCAAWATGSRSSRVASPTSPDRLAADLGIHYSRANELEIVDGRLTGRVVGAVVDRAGKATALREFAADIGVPVDATIAIGDGANDLDMLNAAGLGIAYNAKPLVRDAADASVNVPYLDTILYLLGISREEIEAADAADGIVTPAPPV